MLRADSISLQCAVYPKSELFPRWGVLMVALYSGWKGGIKMYLILKGRLSNFLVHKKNNTREVS